MHVMNKDIQTYNQTQEDAGKIICELLAQEINSHLTGATSKVWHGHPVWFLDDNPIVGYSKRKSGISLMFWSGQSFDEPGLSPEGSFKATEIFYTDAGQVDTDDLKRWIEKSKTIQWDYKNIVKRKGVLERLR